MDGMGGYFLEPTVIKDMTDDMLTTREEVFAPVVRYVCTFRGDAPSTNNPRLV
jgi:acyl-CoA reductase-like NAD-dependent aldehyde dehydrogenase